MPFRTLTGHTRLLELVARAAARGTLPPSLIFAGPDGVGKRAGALALAQLFNCTARGPGAATLQADDEPPDACGECPSCRRIARGVLADVMIVEPGDSGSIKIDQLRQVVERSAYRPFEGRRRVVIIDEADAIEAAAQNTLLKTLEEPPAATTFVLVTARPDVLLPTVLSRCQRLRFSPLPPADVAALLIRDHGFAEADAHAAALLADGSLARALEGDSEGHAESRRRAFAMLKAVAGAAQPGQRLAAARLIAAERRDQLASRLQLLASMLRDLGLLAAQAERQPLANGDLQADLRRLAPAFAADRAVRGFGAVNRALDALDRNASPKIVADWIALQV